MLVLALAACLATSLMAGYRFYPPAAVLAALAGGGDGGAGAAGAESLQVIRDLRLPRAVIAPTVGAALGVAGVLLQSLVRNRIAAPDILGLNAGAALAVVVASVAFGVGSLAGLSLAAGIGALAAALAVYAVATAAGPMSPARTVLTGFTLSGLLISLVQIVLTTDEATLEELLFWMAGGFEGRSLGLVGGAAWLLAAGAVGAALAARPLDALQVDDDAARGLGVAVLRTRLLAFAAVAALTGAAVAIAGPVGFVGLVVPHVARALVGPRHGPVLITAGLAGAVFALLADIGARFLIYPSEAPVGVVTALVGAPVLIALLRRGAAG